MATRLMTFKWCKENNDHAKKKPIPNSNQLMTSSKFSEYINSEQFNSEPSNKIITRYEVPEIISSNIDAVVRTSDTNYRIFFKEPVNSYYRREVGSTESVQVFNSPAKKAHNYFTTTEGKRYEFSTNEVDWVPAWGLKINGTSSVIIDNVSEGFEEIGVSYKLNTITSNIDIVSGYYRYLRYEVQGSYVTPLYETHHPNNKYYIGSQDNTGKYNRFTKMIMQANFGSYDNTHIELYYGYDPYNTYISQIPRSSLERINRLFFSTSSITDGYLHVFGLRSATIIKYIDTIDEIPGNIFLLNEGSGNKLHSKNGNETATIDSMNWVKI